MILCDKEIYQLSVPPDIIVTSRAIEDQPEPTLVTTGYWSPDTSLLDALKLPDGDLSEGIVDYRRITEEEADAHVKMVSPFYSEQVKVDADGNRLISFGLSSYGYDIRIADEFKIFSNINATVIDPKNFDDRVFVDFKGPVCIIPPNSFVLARSIEYFNMPRDVSGIVLGKSTLARCGCSCLATPLEAGWSGHVTLEFANTTPLPMMIYANEGAAQVVFLKGNPCQVSYADRGGKYQGQTGITLPKV